MASYDVHDYLEDAHVVLEGIVSPAHPKGKAYRFESPSFEVGLWLHNLVDFGKQAALISQKPEEQAAFMLKNAERLGKLDLTRSEEEDLYRNVMGDTLDELNADGVVWGRVQLIFKLLLKHWGNDEPIEQIIAGGQGNSPARTNRATRRATPSSSPRAGKSSSRASTATARRTTGRTSTRGSSTPASSKRAAAS